MTYFVFLDREEVKYVVDDWIFGEMRFGRKLDTPDQTIKVKFVTLRKCLN